MSFGYLYNVHIWIVTVCVSGRESVCVFVWACVCEWEREQNGLIVGGEGKKKKAKGSNQMLHYRCMIDGHHRSRSSNSWSKILLFSRWRLRSTHLRKCDLTIFILKHIFRFTQKWSFFYAPLGLLFFRVDQGLVQTTLWIISKSKEIRVHQFWNTLCQLKL